MTLARKMDGFWTDCERRTLVPLNNGAKAVRVFDIGSITTDEWSYSQLLLYSGINIPEDSGAVICIAKLKSPDRLGVNPLDMPRTPYRASEGNHSQSPHHALSPHPHIVICTSCISSMDCTGFSVLQCHLNDI